MVVESALRAIKRHNDIENSMKGPLRAQIFALSLWTFFEYSIPSCISIVEDCP